MAKLKLPIYKIEDERLVREKDPSRRYSRAFLSAIAGSYWHELTDAKEGVLDTEQVVKIRCCYVSVRRLSHCLQR